MKPDLSPVWPWKLLEPFLDKSDGVVQTLLALAAHLVLLVPFFLWRRPSGLSARKLLGGAGMLFVIILGWIWARTATAASLGIAALVLVPLALIALTIWAYLGTNGASLGKILGVLLLRLAAFALALLAVLRPSFAFGDKNQERTLLVIALDRSKSMGDVKDHGKDQSRWSALLQHLEEAAPELKLLAEEDKIDVVFRAFGADVVEFDPANPLAPTDPRSDYGDALRKLHEELAGRKPRAVLLLGDGADTGGAYNTLDEARRFRPLLCPVHVFAYGNPNTPNNVRAVSVIAAVAEPSPVMAKGDLTVRATIDAPGFVGKVVRVKVLLNNEEIASQDVELENSRGNEVRIKCTAPPKPGEYDLIVRVEDPRIAGNPPPGQMSTARNELTTFLTVSKEGISVLLVDKQRAFEPQAICDALQDRRIRLHTVWLRGDKPLDKNVGDLFQFDKQQYDVILLGDVTANQMRAVNPNALDEIKKLVGERGAGLMMIGGYSSFAKSVWKGTPIAEMLPVELSEGQEEKPVQMKPTEAGLRRFGFLMKIGDRKEDSAEAWESLSKLEGYTKLGAPRQFPPATVLASTDDDKKDPLLVMMNYGGGRGSNEGNAGRVLAFAGDTTHRWIVDDKTLEMHTRFWKQTVLWLAKQEDPDGNIWVRPDVRRLPVRGETGFSVRMRKGDFDVTEGEFTVKLRGPGLDKNGVNLTTSAGRDGWRGAIDREKTKHPGLYTLEATGTGKDSEGNKFEVKEPKEVKFFVYDDDLETSQQAADHAFLKKLAKAGNGEFHEGKELAAFLHDLHKQTREESRGRERHWPDWRTTGKSPFLVFFYLAFVAVLTGEWLLRRRWGMV